MSRAKRRREARRAARREARERSLRQTIERYDSVLQIPEPQEPEERPVDERERAKDRGDEGWRTSRRTSRAGKGLRKSKRRAERAESTRARTSEVFRAGGRAVARALRTIGYLLVGVAIVAVTMFALANFINWFARWDAERRAADEPTPAEMAEDNLLVIGAEDHTVAGFLALRHEEAESRVFGIAIPDAAFMEVPGQGFERAGDSYQDGPEVSAAAISNFLTVTFDQWVVVDTAAYQTALQEQSLSDLLTTVRDTNMDPGDVGRFARVFEEVSGEAVALVPLPVKPISLGDETYFEPQRDEVADLLFSWWGVSMASDKDVVRVIVYNGSGEPGIAGAAAQELIRQGFRVVETRNADSFDYEQTLVVLHDGEVVDAERVRQALGVGQIVQEDSNQQIADVIVIVGKDFSPPAEDG